MFHALTGCDTVSFFAGCGKRTACEVWTAVPELTQVLVDLTTAPEQVDEDAAHTIERLVILLYDRTSTSTDVDKTRCKLFARKNNVQLTPPTSAALNSMSDEPCTAGRACLGPGSASCTSTAIPDRLGLHQDERPDIRRHWTTLPEASEVCRELVSCKCQKGCTQKCKCKKANLECTQLCECDGECSEN